MTSQDAETLNRLVEERNDTSPIHDPLFKAALSKLWNIYKLTYMIPKKDFECNQLVFDTYGILQREESIAVQMAITKLLDPCFDRRLAHDQAVKDWRKDHVVVNGHEGVTYDTFERRMYEVACIASDNTTEVYNLVGFIDVVIKLISTPDKNDPSIRSFIPLSEVPNYIECRKEIRQAVNLVGSKRRKNDNDDNDDDMNVIEHNIQPMNKIDPVRDVLLEKHPYAEKITTKEKKIKNRRKQKSSSASSSSSMRITPLTSSQRNSMDVSRKGSIVDIRKQTTNQKRLTPLIIDARKLVTPNNIDDDNNDSNDSNDELILDNDLLSHQDIIHISKKNQFANLPESRSMHSAPVPIVVEGVKRNNPIDELLTTEHYKEQLSKSIMKLMEETKRESKSVEDVRREDDDDNDNDDDKTKVNFIGQKELKEHCQKELQQAEEIIQNDLEYINKKNHSPIQLHKPLLKPIIQRSIVELTLEEKLELSYQSSLNLEKPRKRGTRKKKKKYDDDNNDNDNNMKNYDDDNNDNDNNDNDNNMKNQSVSYDKTLIYRKMETDDDNHIVFPYVPHYLRFPPTFPKEDDVNTKRLIEDFRKWRTKHYNYKSKYLPVMDESLVTWTEEKKKLIENELVRKRILEEETRKKRKEGDTYDYNYDTYDINMDNHLCTVQLRVNTRNDKKKGQKVIPITSRQVVRAFKTARRPPTPKQKDIVEFKGNRASYHYDNAKREAALQSQFILNLSATGTGAFSLLNSVSSEIYDNDDNNV